MASHDMIEPIPRGGVSRPRAVSLCSCLHAGRDRARASRSDMKRCHVPGCSVTTILRPGISLFRLPQNAKRARLWLDAIQRKPRRSILVCEDHFTARQIRAFNMRKRLLLGAVPTLRLPPAPVAAAPSPSSSDDDDDDDDEAEQTPEPRSPNHNTLSHQTDRPQPPADNNPELETLIALGQTYLTPELAKCIEIQTMLTYEKKAIAEGNLSDENFLYQALKLRFTFPQTYKVMWKPLGLPSALALRRLFRPLTWEINEQWACLLRARFVGAAAAARECAVCVVRAVGLRPALGYDAVRDRLRGLDELDGAQRPRTARQGLAVWARGVHANWAQPLACCLLADDADLQEIWLWIDIIISKLFDVGLKVRAVVTDYEDRLINKARPVVQQQPYFTVNKRQIYRLYDWNQVIVAFRDCLIKHDIRFGGNVASWNDIVSLFEHDTSNTVKLAPGLSATHVRPSRARCGRTTLARGVLAAPVAGALAIAVERAVLPRSALGTAQLLNSISLLVEILSKKSLDTKVYSGVTVRNDLSRLKDMQPLLADMSVVDVSTSRSGRPERPAFALAALRGHVHAVRALADRARTAGHETLPLSAFDNQPLHSLHDDALSRDARPTTKRFLEGFRKSFVSNVMKPVKTASSEMEDYGSFLSMAGDMRGVSSQERAREPPAGMVPRAQVAPLLQAHGPPLTRLLLAQCLARHEGCAPALAYCLRPVPPPPLLSLLGQLERHFCAQAAAEGPTGLRPLLRRAAEVGFDPPCPCFPVDFLKTLYMSFRLRSLIDYNNAKRRHEYAVNAIQTDGKAVAT